MTAFARDRKTLKVFDAGRKHLCRRRDKGAGICWGDQSLAGNTFASAIKQLSKVLTLAKPLQLWTLWSGTCCPHP